MAFKIVLYINIFFFPFSFIITSAKLHIISLYIHFVSFHITLFPSIIRNFLIFISLCLFLIEQYLFLIIKGWNIAFIKRVLLTTQGWNKGAAHVVFILCECVNIISNCKKYWKTPFCFIEQKISYLSFEKQTNDFFYIVDNLSNSNFPQRKTTLIN